MKIESAFFMPFVSSLTHMNLQSEPKSILFIGAIGAGVTTILLGLVLTQFETEFGIPKDTLYIMASFPCLFIIYDLIGFLFISASFNKRTKEIAWLNLGYCLLSLIMLVFHRNDLTFLGWIYFVAELAIVLFLANLELNLAKNEIA